MGFRHAPVVEMLAVLTMRLSQSGRGTQQMRSVGATAWAGTLDMGMQVDERGSLSHMASCGS